MYQVSWMFQTKTMSEADYAELVNRKLTLRDEANGIQLSSGTILHQPTT